MIDSPSFPQGTRLQFEFLQGNVGLDEAADYLLKLVSSLTELCFNLYCSCPFSHLESTLVTTSNNTLGNRIETSI